MPLNSINRIFKFITMLSKETVVSKFFFLILVFVFVDYSPAAFEPKAIGVYAISAGQANIADSCGLFSVFNNPAKLLYNHKQRINVFYKDYYSMGEIGLSALSAEGHILGFPVSFGISHFGNRLYSEQQVRLAAAYIFWDKRI